MLWSEQVLAGGRLRAVVLNAKYANACTGPAGFQITHATAEAVAAALGIGAGEVACLLHRQDRRTAATVEAAGRRRRSPPRRCRADGGADAADAIRTTDTVSKQTVVAGAGWSVGGMAKGAGMLAPGAGHDAVRPHDRRGRRAQPTLDRALRAATRVTFDRVDSDGCMSTNDTVLLLASGASGVTPYVR